MLRRVFQLPTSEAELSTAQPYARGDAFAYCEELARKSAEAFPIASRFVPA